MKRLLLLLASLLVIGFGGEAQAWTHGVASGGSGNSPLVLPGANQPIPTANSGTQPILVYSPGYNTISPTQHGSNTDYGYGVKGSIRWNAVQYSNITSTTQVGLFAWHTGTAAQIAAGQASNIDHVDISCDNGSWYTITGQTVDNGLGGGQTDWNFTINPASYSPGVHSCKARAVPTTGPDIIAEGPAADQYGHTYETTKAALSRLDSGGATFGTAGNILTILDTNLLNWSSINLGSTAVISIGDSVSAIGAGADTFIDGDSTHNATSCAAATGSNCNGAGSMGTYHTTQAGLAAQAVFTATISGTLMTVSSVASGYISTGGAAMIGPGISAGTLVNSQSSGTTGGPGVYVLNNSFTIPSATVMYEPTGMTFATERSFYFTTGISPLAYFVSLSGNDSTGTGTASSPYLTTGKALLQLEANGVLVGSTWQGIYGGAVCLENGSSYAYSNYSNSPGSAFGYTEYRSAKAGDPICPNAGDPGGATLTNITPTSRQYWPAHTKFSYLNFIGTANNASGGDAWYLVADHVSQKHDLLDNGGIFGNGGYYCLEVTSWFGADGGCSSAVMVRGSSLKYSDSDGMHDVPVEVGNTVDGDGNALEWMTGQFNSGTPNVITNVQILPSELSGYTLSQIVSLIAAWTLERTDGAEVNCYTSRSNQVASVDDTNHTITMTGATSSGSCANGYTGYVYYSGNHPDDFQLQITSQHSDVYISGNSFNGTYPSYTQGAFVETMGIASAYIGHNAINTDTTGVEQMFPVDGNNEAFISDQNTFHGTASFGSFDNIFGSSLETMVKDQCLSGGTITPKGSPQHRLTAASSACYTSLP